jgi:hypothetical protein
MSVSPEAVKEFLDRECVPKGYKYTLVLASITKRVLQMQPPDEWKLQFLGHLEKMSHGEQWLTAEMIAAVEPMDDKGEEIAREIRKVGPMKALDVYADTFTVFATLNPSLVAALKMSPLYRYLKQEAGDAAVEYAVREGNGATQGSPYPDNTRGGSTFDFSLVN